MIAGVGRAAITGLALAGAVAAEFEASAPPSPPREPKSTGRPRTDALVRASRLIEAAVVPLEREQPGVAAAVRAAGIAVLRSTWMPREDLNAIYAYVEAEIPFADLKASRTDGDASA
jgi:hypothetical protein